MASLNNSLSNQLVDAATDLNVVISLTVYSLLN